MKNLISQKQHDKVSEMMAEACEVVARIYSSFDGTHEIKSDNSPLTAADTAANDLIVKTLGRVANYPVISEELGVVDYNQRKKWSTFWLVDPLDGTKEFIKKTGEFTINVALVHEGIPVLGWVSAPALNLNYLRSLDGNSYKESGDLKRQILVRKPPGAYDQNPLIIAGSRSHSGREFDNYISQFSNIELISMGSSLKICLIAEGLADLYPRLGPTYEWDTAAAHAILLGAGGDIYDFYKNLPLTYNGETLLNPYFVARSKSFDSKIT